MVLLPERAQKQPKPNFHETRTHHSTQLLTRTCIYTAFWAEATRVHNRSDYRMKETVDSYEKEAIDSSRPFGGSIIRSYALAGAGLTGKVYTAVRHLYFYIQWTRKLHPSFSFSRLTIAKTGMEGCITPKAIGLKCLFMRQTRKRQKRRQTKPRIHIRSPRFGRVFAGTGKRESREDRRGGGGGGRDGQGPSSI